jgi:hypothetical protein
VRSSNLHLERHTHSSSSSIKLYQSATQQEQQQVPSRFISRLTRPRCAAATSTWSATHTAAAAASSSTRAPHSRSSSRCLAGSSAGLHDHGARQQPPPVQFRDNSSKRDSNSKWCGIQGCQCLDSAAVNLAGHGARHNLHLEPHSSSSSSGCLLAAQHCALYTTAITCGMIQDTWETACTMQSVSSRNLCLVRCSAQ